jgi:hypothetical protein
MTREVRAALLAAVVSAMIGVGGALLNAWQDIATLKLRVEQIQDDHARLRSWLTKMGERQDYYHGGHNEPPPAPAQ